MADRDPEQERQRLTKLYAEMSDGELAAIAVDSAELTDMARRALTDELARRHPEEVAVLGADASPGHDSVELADVVSIRQFRDLHEALLAKGALDSAEIESFLVDDNMIRMDWFWSNLIGGIKLCVKQEDAETALDLLGQSIPGEFEVEGIGAYEQPHCPKCQSLDITFQDLNPSVAWVSAYVIGFPILLHRKRWLCNSCGEKWRQTEDIEAVP
jgi:hypothetical protein